MTRRSTQAFVDVVLKAAPFSERVDGHWFAPSGPADAKFVDAWCAVVTGDQPEFLPQVLDAVGLTTADLERGFSPVSFRADTPTNATADSEAGPPWVSALDRLLCACDSPIDPADVVPMGPIYADVWRHLLSAGRVLAAERVQRWPVALSQPAVDALADSLAQRVVKAVVRAIEPEAMVAHTLGLPPEVGLPGDGAAWFARLEEMPALAYPIGCATADWLAFIDRLAERLAADLPAIVSMLGRTALPTAVQSIRCDAGDPHEGGQSVAIIAFDDNLRIAYKPKPQDGAVAFSRLATVLNGHPALQAAEIRLPVRAHLACDGYGWDEVIPAGPTDADDVTIWGRCYGAWLGLLELLEARDMWLDNVVLAESLPHLIDVETMLQPHHLGATVADQLLGETVWPTGAVTCLTYLPDGDVEDIGTVTPPRVLRLPFSGSDFGDRDAGNVASDGVVRWALPAWRPLGGEAGTLMHAIMAGYDAVDAAISDTELREALIGSIQALADAPGRVVLRSTFVCYRILHDSLGPAVLTDGRQREVHLAALMRPGARLLGSSDPTERAYGRRALLLGSADRRALERLDIPLVRHDPRTSEVLLTDGTTVEDWFDGVPIDRVIRRLATRAETADLRRTVLLLAVELAVAADEPREARAALLERSETALCDALVAAGANSDAAVDAVRMVRA